MIKLDKMNNQEFKKYLDFMIPDYAKDISSNYNLPMDKAIEESVMMMKDMFPDGLSTKGQFLYNIYDLDLNRKVGILWFNINTEIDRAYLYHIYIKEAYRKTGYGTRALEELQVRVKELGMNSIALSVFGNNKTAHRLMKKWVILPLLYPCIRFYKQVIDCLHGCALLFKSCPEHKASYEKNEFY